MVWITYSRQFIFPLAFSCTSFHDSGTQNASQTRRTRVCTYIGPTHTKLHLTDVNCTRQRAERGYRSAACYSSVSQAYPHTFLALKMVTSLSLHQLVRFVGVYSSGHSTAKFIKWFELLTKIEDPDFVLNPLSTATGYGQLDCLAEEYRISRYNFKEQSPGEATCRSVN
jgi:hypothetical protein